MQAVAQDTLGEVDALVQDCLAPKDALEPVPLAEVMQRAQDGLVTIIDVRPPHEFAAAHLPGAINLPLAELAQRLGELPAGRAVVAYCRGRYCVLVVRSRRPLAPGRLRGPPHRGRHARAGSLMSSLWRERRPATESNLCRITPEYRANNDRSTLG
jgi:hypothetical protein